MQIQYYYIIIITHTQARVSSLGYKSLLVTLAGSVRRRVKWFLRSAQLSFKFSTARFFSFLMIRAWFAFLSDPSPIIAIALSCSSLTKSVLLLRLDWGYPCVWRCMQPLKKSRNLSLHCLNSCCQFWQPVQLFTLEQNKSNAVVAGMGMFHTSCK